jgi:YfiH family protein
MSFKSNEGIRFFQFNNFSDRITQGVFTRQGGTSPAPWESLNLGGTVGDDTKRVRSNREKALRTLDRDPASVFDVWQVHGTNVAIAEAARPEDTPHIQADVILTNSPKVTILMRFADCVPILLHDPIRNVIGMVHAGWMGTVLGTVKEAVRTMQVHFGCDPVNIQAGIGPSIGPDHYEIGPDVVTKVRQAFENEASGLLIENKGAFHFDLWKANRLLLKKMGVEKIETAEICTACNLQDWYSHRAEKGRTGRFGAVIAMNS